MVKQRLFLNSIKRLNRLRASHPAIPWVIQVLPLRGKEANPEGIKDEYLGLGSSF